MPSQGGCCAHDHDCASAECAPAYSLYKHIDIARVRCLNEDVDGSVKGVFRPWPQRTQPLEQPLRSDPDDPELLIHVPFDGQVKLNAICVIGGPEGRAPTRLRVFTNREDLDFGSVQGMAAVQEWDLQEDNQRGLLEYPTQITKFGGVHSIDLHFPGAFVGDQSEIHFIGFKGEFTQRQRRAVEAVYEARAVPGDHKVPGTELGSHSHIS